MSRKTVTLAAVATLLLIVAAAALPPQESGQRPYDALRAEAEKFYEEKSFSRARHIYEQAAKLALTADQKAWVEFRIADTTWRADAASPDPSGTVMSAASGLERLAQSAANPRIAAEANESRGDLELRHPSYRNPSGAQRFYLPALEYWAGSDEIELARSRYLSIVRRMVESYRWNIPREVLVNAVRIAVTEEDRSWTRFFLATQLLTDSNPASVERAFELLEEVVRSAVRTEWYDDALYAYASGLMTWSDIAARSDDDDPLPAPDYEKALRLFRQITRDYSSLNSEHYDDALRKIEELTTASVRVMVGSTFLPGAEQDFQLAWRNVPRIELTLYAIDLTAAGMSWERRHGWKRSIETTTLPVVRRWTHETETAAYEPGQETVKVNPRLAPGAYVVHARSPGAQGMGSQELLLVTDAHVLVHAMADRAKVFVSDVVTGEPIANARVRGWTQEGSDLGVTATTDANGLAELRVGGGGVGLVAAAAGQSRQAWVQTYVSGFTENDRAEWRVYAFTDRPAYRPNEKVQWKIIARTRDDNRWITPSGVLEYTITGPRGEKVASGLAALNAFGSFWSELPLTDSMALGAYTITFGAEGNYKGSAQLFRLEEYKLPEFIVSVSTPENTQYRLGDTIEATIDASYYFGGPVANATVEAVVYQSPLVRYWYPWRHYPWYWQDHGRHHGYGHSQTVSTQTLKTDANGRAMLRIDTPRDGSDMTYRIEARVIDASRREVRGEGSVRVTRQRYTVMVQPERHVYRPGERASVRFRAVDANDKPVRVTGEVEVIRRRWKDRAYTDETMMTAKLDTDVEGEATLTFTPKQDGYYAVRWKSFDGEGRRARDVVSAETTLWVADRASTDIGYHHQGGLELIVDREAMRSGETASVLVVAPESGRWVMLTSSSDTILDTRIVKLDGTAKLVQFEIGDRHVPNFFVTASSVFQRALATDTERVVVPPVEHFLSVDVKSDREQYEPRQEATVEITTRDADGQPVPAEVALAVSDEAVTAIQSDPAGDPRRFFYGETHGGTPMVIAGVHSQRYVSREDAQAEELARERQEGGVEGRVARGVVGGAVGGVVGGYVADLAVPRSMTVTATAPTMAPPPAPVPQAVAPPPMDKAAVGAAGATIDVVVRSDFRSTAFWKPDVVTDASGRATVAVKFPEALTTWRATARAATTGDAFGIGTSTARTQLPLLVRLQAPRFFVVGDRTVVSAVINNNTGAAMTVTPSLEVEGLRGGAASAAVAVPANGERRVDWTLTAEQAGNAKLRVAARGATHGDAMEKSFVVYEHGIDKLIARSGKLRGDEAIVRLELPRERRATDLTIQVAPSLATTMLDALPYLLEFPYGCTEQTMSRFLPAAIVARTLEKLGASAEETRGRLPQLDAVTAAGMRRLYGMQHENGAWGWWEEGPDDEWMTAYVVWGFALAREGGLKIDVRAVGRAAEWLSMRLVENRDDINDQAWLLHALSAWNPTPGTAEKAAYDNIWTKRDRMSAYARALFALTAHRYGQSEHARVLVRNLEDGVSVDRTPDQSVLLKGETAKETMATAHWGAANRFWWRWYEGPVETTAFVLQALVTIDPQHRLIEPAMNWLVKNRRGAQWTNTRDTAIALLALNDYLEQSGELRGDVAYEVTVNGRVVATKAVTAADVLRAPSRFTVSPDLLSDAIQEVRIRRTGGTGPIYFAAEARFVSLEEPVKAAGNEMFVRREYFRLEPRPTLLKGMLYDEVPLRDGETVASGDRIEVVVTIDVKNAYEYLLFEDLKPAGFEAVELQSGKPLYASGEETGRSAWVYQELRDRKVALFVDRLEQGLWKIRYTLRAEVPGSFHALPLLGQAMYVPDIRANGDEVRVAVRE